MGRESCRAERGQSRQGKGLGWVLFSQRKRPGLWNRQVWVDLDSSLINGYLWASYFTTLFCSKKIIIVPMLVGFLLGINRHPRESVESKESMPCGHSLLFKTFVLPQPVRPRLSIQFIRWPYIKSVLCTWLLEGAGNTNKNPHIVPILRLLAMSRDLDT